MSVIITTVDDRSTACLTRSTAMTVFWLTFVAAIWAMGGTGSEKVECVKLAIYIDLLLVNLGEDLWKAVLALHNQL